MPFLEERRSFHEKLHVHQPFVRIQTMLSQFRVFCLNELPEYDLHGHK